jgi:hypothetical protein
MKRNVCILIISVLYRELASYDLNPAFAASSRPWDLHWEKGKERFTWQKVLSYGI